MRAQFIGVLLSVVLAGAVESQQTAAPPARPRYAQQFYPAPSHLPPGFVFVGLHADVPDGFKGGPSELRLLYQNMDLPEGVRVPSPLMIFIAPNPQAEFAIANEATTTTVAVTVQGDTISAEYRDGMWVPDPNGERVLPSGDHLRWRTDAMHSLVFKWQGLSIGIRGSRTTGVSYEELLRVASSLNGYWLRSR